MAASYKWHPITDLGSDPQQLTEGELDSLRRVWEDQKRALSGESVLDEFGRRLRREWAIETGIIEDVYTLDRGVTRTLIERGIDAALIPHDATNRDNVLVARIIQDHYDALEGMLDFVGGQRPLSTSYIKELHAALLRNQDTHTVVDQFGRAFDKPLERGLYKTSPNNPTRTDGSVHEYCPPEHVASEMDRLILMHRSHPPNIPPEVEAAWLHHRFTQIHPFADGNGRVARAIASLVFIKAGWFPLIVKREDRSHYLEALEAADDNDLRPLVSLFVGAQRNALVQATEVAYDVTPVASEDDAIAAIRDRLRIRGKLPLEGWLAAKSTAGQLLASADQRFKQVAQKLHQELAGVGRNFSFGSAPVGTKGPPSEAQARAVREAGRAADFAEYNALEQLWLNTDQRYMLVLSFHAIGPRYRGIIGVVAYLEVPGDVLVLEGGTFLINYAEDPASAQARFSNWLDRIIVQGLNEWRRVL